MNVKSCLYLCVCLVLIFLAIGRGRRRVKKAGPAEDQISQSSYMTYSTTISDHSVHYGPNWDKVHCKQFYEFVPKMFDALSKSTV